MMSVTQPLAGTRSILAPGLILALTLIASAELSRTLTVPGEAISAIWPPSGIMLGACLALGSRFLLLLVPALWLWMVGFQDYAPGTGMLVALGQGSGTLAGCWLIRRFWKDNRHVRPVVSQLMLYIRGAVIGGGLSSLVGALVLFRLESPPVMFHDLWLVYWLFDGLGIILFAPATFLILVNEQRFLSDLRCELRRPAIRWWLALAGTLSILALGFSRLTNEAYAPAIGFAYFPLLCWAVLQTRASLTALVIPLFALLYVAFSLHGLAGFPDVRTITDLVGILLVLMGLVIFAQMIAATSLERTRLLQSFRQQANTDFLTGLGNDRALSQMLEARFTRQGQWRASPDWLVYLQVLDFDQLGDLLGYRSTRKLETLLAECLKEAVGPDAMPSRIGDGVYAFVLHSVDMESIRRQVESVYQKFNDQMFAAGDHDTRIRVAAGVIPLDQHARDHNQQLSAVIQAAQLARHDLHRVMIIEDVAGFMARRGELTQRMEVLKRALSEERLELFAQPIRPLGPEPELLSYEILLRLRTESGELLGPGQFLPAAEAFGFMMEIDQWVISRTLRMLADNPEWLAMTRKCSINIAGTTLSSGDIAGFVAAQLEATGVPAGCLSFEITETEQIRRLDVARTVVSEFRRQGCSVSLDDFGTGLATFDYLKSFELDYVKIDGAFIRELETDPYDRSIVRSICEVAGEMGLQTIAEFVEGENVVAMLRELGVDYGQGFGLGRPEPLAAIFAVGSGNTRTITA
ncbi:EAL domain, c-di-GMP-specific phosphodiesterase class I (or its enzymatically inactive variant) [Marinobacter daqiaonensis]|uniref:EAL domain, c-di-GMP-specific phosphodiesterase class I (Or its enzymatically inactive variant) n=1 Tax=Marinobacter daqiaonensis TaxID=650891 RepID=A0A1I6IL91_9GAMM|nr:EAL domain-containing protein [Marinobacter daqiaonensis]SFR67486.1 EAL domain, c-di-GMP-specific phosphodiesterase class I (or its enzymatically inactive variant) [Marinobacter daqiaonensis]